MSSLTRIYPYPAFIKANNQTLTLVFSALLLFFGAISNVIADAQGVIKVNQVGYLPSASKVAIVSASKEKRFHVVRVADSKVVYSADLSAPKDWSFSQESVQQADFSSFTLDGEYQIKVAETLSSSFSIGDDALDSVHKAAIKSFYFNRAGIEIDKEYGGKFARAAGHPDTSVKIHKSAASKERPEGFVVSAPKGWYDAGDYGKYVVNSGISTYTMLLAYQHFSELYDQLNLTIPESNNEVPDLLDEIKWNLDWMQTMQDSDGGVYHKLTALKFSALDAKPKDHKNQRWMIGKSVTATLDFAAVMAVASRVFESYKDEFPSLSEQYQQQAIRAYAWAKANPEALYQQPGDVHTGAYDDEDSNDEFAWAAAELFLRTGDKTYLADFEQRNADPSEHLTWSQVSALPYVSLLNYGEELLGKTDYSRLQTKFFDAADQHLSNHKASAYNVAMIADDFQWGSNSSALNNGLVMYQAYRLSGETRYQHGALSTLNYVLGTNATDYSFVTGYGDKTPMNIHHRPSVADALTEPVPGFIAGGPHTGRQDKCDYPGDLPATNYVDHDCSYSTNEIAINWNAPLVYMLGAAISDK